MRVNKPKLHPMARAALIEIQSSGVDVTPDIVLWVHDAATRISSNPPRPVSDLVDWPVTCGGVSLYPLSFGAASWLQALPDRIRDDVRAIAFACVHSKKPEVFEEIRGAVAAVWAVVKWTSRLRCSMAALSASVDQVLGLYEMADVPDASPREAKPDSDSCDWGGMIRALCMRYPGTSPEYWTWGVSREKALSMLQSANSDLPEENQVSEYELESNFAFRSIVESIKAGTYGG